MAVVIHSITLTQSSDKVTRTALPKSVGLRLATLSLHAASLCEISAILRIEKEEKQTFMMW